MIRNTSHLGDEVYALFTRALAPDATMAYALESGTGPAGCLVVCAKPLCANPDGPDGTKYTALPLTQEQLDEWAVKQNRPVACEICGAWLTEVVKGSDSRD